MTTDDKRTIRKLAAIVVADVMHYSRQMEADEVGTLARLKSLRLEILDPAMRAHEGRLVKLMGDGLLAEFASAIDATEWALSVQRAIAARNENLPEAAQMSLRVGVNVGDVIVEGDDLYGEGVNVAARLEPLAPPGGICISSAVHDHVSGKVDAVFAARGERTVKNIARPLSIFCWSPTTLDEGDSVPFAPRARGAKPSLAVRAFEATGSSGDAMMLASAVYDATVGSLATLSGITVLSDATRADYVAGATIQVVGQRYRAMVRMVDNRSGEQFWSIRFDGDLSEFFDAQDDLAYRVSQALRFSIYDREVAEMEKLPVAERTTEQILGRIGQTIAGANRHEWPEAGPRLDSIILASPDEAGPRAMKACWHLHDVFYGWREITSEDRSAAIAMAREAVRRNDRSDFAHMTLALIHLYCERDVDRALRESERALELSPYYTLARYTQGLALVFAGRAAEGMPLCRRSVDVSSRLVMNPRIMQGAALGAFLLEQHDEAMDWAKRADHQSHDVAPTLLILAAAAGAAGADGDAATARDRLLTLFPDLRLSELRRWPFRHPADHDRFLAGLVSAGLPA